MHIARMQLPKGLAEKKNCANLSSVKFIFMLIVR